MRAAVVVLALVACGDREPDVVRRRVDRDERPRTPPPGAPGLDPDAPTPAPRARDDLPNGGGGAIGGVTGGGVAGGRPTLGADPAPAGCADPITGVWLARTHDGGRWHEHRVTITRERGQLRAAQTTRFWDGGVDRTLPPPCGDDRAWATVEMRDDLTWRENILHVWGEEIVQVKSACGMDGSDYHLDSFTGPVRGETYAAVNNDGHGAVDRPYRFRRIACAGP